MIGESHPRPSAMLKACGLAEFAADIKLKNPLEIAAVHSTQHHAIIKSIDSAAAKKMPGVMGILTADDIKGTNRLRMFVPDQPVLCEDSSAPLETRLLLWPQKPVTKPGPPPQLLKCSMNLCRS